MKKKTSVDESPNEREPRSRKTSSLKFPRAVLAIILMAALFSPAAVKAIETEGGLINLLKVSAEAGRKRLEGWKIKEWRGKADIDIVETETGHAIHLKSRSTSTALYKEIKFDARQYPVIKWKWKAVKLPKGADVRRRDSDDQALQIYVTFEKWPSIISTSLNTRTVGYIWDTSAPADTVVTSRKSSSTRYIVVRSGQGEVGEWIEEERNVYEDYKRLFREDPPKGTAVSVMIDSDDTKSYAESFVGEIFLAER